mmetsp:Transcript_21543/g.23498  ORF Transcript_21543/g.23498 Transcript_21543/m.23498 type:complete len:95 (+) Transcript_21543:2372-2656(+)
MRKWKTTRLDAIMDDMRKGGGMEGSWWDRDKNWSLFNVGSVPEAGYNHSLGVQQGGKGIRGDAGKNYERDLSMWFRKSHRGANVGGQERLVCVV